ncbi:hypothetical protein, partial [Enterococcus faecium]|uniref:hypothetical protein n=1 Tax=Enterococcus faecium TaxID=1352 RepID=UPI0013037218
MTKAETQIFKSGIFRFFEFLKKNKSIESFSYTHLTLPTTYSVKASGVDVPLLQQHKNFTMRRS